MSGRAARFTEADVRRAINGAAKSGARDYRVLIAADGSIEIVLGAAARATARPNSCDDLLN